MKTGVRVLLVLMTVGVFSVWLFLREGTTVEVYTKNRVSKEELSGFLAEIKGRFIFVKGGSFLMGDYGRLHGQERLRLDSEARSLPLHEVVLSDFYIDRYKITNYDFDLYLRYHGYSRRTDASAGMHSFFRTHPRLAANIDWFEAERYCSWLASISNVPFSMATEAQWEYAARSRGQFLMVATDDGSYNYKASKSGVEGVNISSSLDRSNFAKEMGWNTDGLTPLPVDRFPPNPLGVYSMSDSGREWVKDWYDPDYYSKSIVKDPQGPEHPVHKDPMGRATKVVRGQSLANEHWRVGVNVHRGFFNPHAFGTDNDFPLLSGKTARCVVNGSKI